MTRIEVCLPPIINHVLSLLQTILSKYMTLSLLDPNDIDIPPHRHCHEADRPHRRPRNQHHHLRVAVRVLDRSPRGRAHRVRQLHRDIRVNEQQIRQLLHRQVFREFLGQNILPDGGGNCRADGAADVAEHAQYSQDDGDMLMRSGGHDGDFVADDDGAGGEGDEELAHDDVANLDAGLAEVDQQARAQDAKGDAEVEADGLVAARAVDQEADSEGADDGTDRVGLDDVAGVSDAEVVDDL